MRGNKISMIFQEPMTSLNPVYTIGYQMVEMLQTHQKISKHDAMQKSIEMLEKVGIPSPEQRIKEYPHQLSGGMRQRVMIAMALSCNPKLLIADEPTTALDVTIQAQILRLMRQLTHDFNTSVILITHDMGVVAEMADHVMVMYAGKDVEYGTLEQIFDHRSTPTPTACCAPSRASTREKMNVFTPLMEPFPPWTRCQKAAASAPAARKRPSGAGNRTPACTPLRMATR